MDERVEWRKDGEERGERASQNRSRNDGRELQRHHGRRTIINFSEIRQLTARYIGYIPEQELYSMTPHEWKDWIIGGQDKLLDIRENNLHSAVAHGMVQGGKRLVGMHKEIEQKRYEIRNQLQEYKRKKEMERRKRYAEREAFKRGTRKMLSKFD